MNTAQNLMAYIGTNRTLVIAGPGRELEKSVSFEDQIFVHVSPEGRLRRYDPEQNAMLKYYIDGKRCSQVIFVGSKHPALMKRIAEDESVHSASTALKFNLSVLLRDKYNSIVNPHIYKQMLAELNVIIQCRMLLDHFLIRNAIDKHKLLLRGLITDINGVHLKSVFHNGIVYNDILTLN
jgi:hypothetical protein